VGVVAIKTWKSFSYNNITFDLRHLNEFEWEYIQAAKNGKPEIKYVFVIEFSLHCFTRGLNKHKNEKWDDIQRDLIYADSREERIFDFARYELSKQLPEITRGISERNCFHTGKENFFIIEILNESGLIQEYEVYFQVSTSKEKLRLFVQSAYVRDVTHKVSQPKKQKISFFVIAHNVKTNKKIRVPPK
jgi:hypothetical protein